MKFILNGLTIIGSILIIGGMSLLAADELQKYAAAKKAKIEEAKCFEAFDLPENPNDT